VTALLATSLVLLAGIMWLAGTSAGSGRLPEGFIPLPDAERESINAALTGVYFTGTEAGQHGIVIIGPTDLKLVELAATEAPRVVYATYRAGRVEGRLQLATDQPGGAIAVAEDGNMLVFCGETYQRIP